MRPRPQPNQTFRVFRFVPLQDFTSLKPIPEIDAQLYAKYDIAATKRQFIESMIKPMI